jgi:hypothetical protein
MKHRDRLLLMLAWIAATAVLSGSTLAQNTSPFALVAAQSACPETMPDVDRVACRVSVAPEPVPAGQRPPAAFAAWVGRQNDYRAQILSLADPLIRPCRRLGRGSAGEPIRR